MDFTILFGDIVPPMYQRCIDSLRRVYPDIVIIRQWLQIGNCPMRMPSDYRHASEALRFYILSIAKEKTRYFDPDVQAFSPLSIEECGAYFADQNSKPDIWAMQNWNSSKVFSECYKAYEAGENIHDVKRILEKNWLYISLIPNSGQYIHHSFHGRG